MDKTIAWISGIAIFLICLYTFFVLGVSVEHVYHKNDIPQDVFFELCPQFRTPDIDPQNEIPKEQDLL